MDLPRFTTGNLGRLTFKDVNTLCDVAERADEFLRNTRRLTSEEPTRKEIWATVTGFSSGSVAGAMNFFEVELSRVSFGVEPRAPTWLPKQNGIVSGNRLLANNEPNPDYQPCFSIARGSPPHLANIGGLVRLTRWRATDGQAYWFIVDREPRSEAFPARIAGNITQVQGSNPIRIFYSWREVRRTTTTTAFEDFEGQFVGATSVPEGSEDRGYALNGAEFAPIPTSLNGAIITRKPIAVGEVVEMTFDVNGAPMFHARNDYGVACP